jgi:hypothetical protein
MRKRCDEFAAFVAFSRRAQLAQQTH